MGVDFYSCAQCRYNFPDCGEYFQCTGCEEHFCSTECGVRKVEVEGDEFVEEVISCVLCRKESATSGDLLRFLLTHFNISYHDAMDLYRKQK